MRDKPRPGSPPQPASFEFEAGILICGRIRACFEGLRFVGSRIEWWEGPGWFSRHFIVKGSVDEVMQARKKILHEITL